MIYRAPVPKVTCDLCGAQRDAKSGTFRKIGKDVVCSWHPHYTPLETHERRMRPKSFRTKPLPNARPFAPLETYDAAEGALLMWLTGSENGVPRWRTDEYTFTEDSGVSSVVGSEPFSSGVLSAAWTAIYLHGFVAENTRSKQAVSHAKVALEEIADWMAARQILGDTAATGYGAWERGVGSDTYYPIHSAAAGLAMLRAYQVIGKPAYLTSARAAAWFCRTAQSGGRLAADFSSTDAGGATRVHHGALTGRIDGAVFDHEYRPDGLAALELWAALKDEVGDEVVGSSDVAGDFSQSRAALLSTCIAEMQAFWTTGVHDATQGQVVNGFSSVTPFGSFVAYPAALGGDGSWRYANGLQATGTRIDSLQWARGLRHLRAVAGDAATATQFDWLVGMSSNTALETPDTDSPRSKWRDALGEYDPRECLGESLQVVGAQQNATTVLATATVGLLAPLYSARQAAGFSRWRTAMSRERPRSVNGLGDGYRHLGILTSRCGLRLQPLGDPPTGRTRPWEVAAAGLMYREAPRHRLGRGGLRP